MKTCQCLALAGLFTLSLVSCQDMSPNAQRGALGGAVIGGVIGHQSGHGLEGAAIGAAAGGLGGHAYDKSKENNY